MGASPTAVAMETSHSEWIWSGLQAWMGQKLMMGCMEIKGKKGINCVNRNFAVFGSDPNVEP